MNISKLNVGVIALGLTNLSLGRDEIAAFLFTIMGQVTLLVVMWYSLKQQPERLAHDLYIESIRLKLKVGGNALAIKKVLEDDQMTAEGYAGFAARHIATKLARTRIDLV